MSHCRNCSRFYGLSNWLRFPFFLSPICLFFCYNTTFVFNKQQFHSLIWGFIGWERTFRFHPDSFAFPRCLRDSGRKDKKAAEILTEGKSSCLWWLTPWAWRQGRQSWWLMADCHSRPMVQAHLCRVLKQAHTPVPETPCCIIATQTQTQSWGGNKSPTGMTIAAWLTQHTHTLAHDPTKHEKYAHWVEPLTCTF